MDFKLLIYSIVLCFLRVHSFSAENELYNFARSKFDYHLSIKTRAEGKQTKQWKNAVCSRLPYIDRYWGPCKTELDESDACTLHLVKNQSSPVVHGPVVIDPKLIDLDIKYDPSDLKLSDYLFPTEFCSQTEFEPCAIAYARCVLSKTVYQNLYGMASFPLLHTYLQLGPKIAHLFPKIEINDYFILNIVNKDYFYGFKRFKGLISSHIIFNYTILSMDTIEIN
uniref:Uncharacterized protein n=1 Tax=Tetranychus urticae TaxID=32264 RepID=T1KAC0_TETUR